MPVDALDGFALASESLLRFLDAPPIYRIRSWLMGLRVGVTVLLLAYGIWMSCYLWEVRDVDDVDQTAEMERRMYMHRFWIGDSHGIFTLIFQVWQFYLLLSLFLYVLSFALQSYKSR